MEKLKVYLPKTLNEKFEMLRSWIAEFVSLNLNQYKLNVNNNELILENLVNNEIVVFTKSETKSKLTLKSVFYISDKTFNKTNSLTERTIYKFLYGNKARFLPL
ncbi:hypothetical protein D3C86_1794420 [compost metagenome]